MSFEWNIKNSQWSCKSGKFIYSSNYWDLSFWGLLGFIEKSLHIFKCEDDSHSGGEGENQSEGEGESESKRDEGRGANESALKSWYC